MSSLNLSFVLPSETIFIVSSTGVISEPTSSTVPIGNARGILVTELGQSTIDTLGPSSNGYILSSNNSATYGVEWVPNTGGGGGSSILTYVEVITNGATLGTNHTNVVKNPVILGSPVYYVGTMPDATVVGTKTIILAEYLGPLGSTYTVTINMANGSTTALFDAVGQGMSVIWTPSGWILEHGGATIT